MFRRLPPVVQFIYIGVIGVFFGTIAGLVNELFQKPFSASNALVWLFLMIISACIATAITMYGRGKFD
ncbi:MAG: hypothetical protein H7319_16105 [Spirosoma sp.]|nr:hypothetical protein [Spirosoma sp.]